jgi:chaperone required for assembly of F1-ATPase
MKRFYKGAGVIERDGRWAVALDGRPVRTPAGATLALENRSAAELLAAEWEAQGPDVQPHIMPLTRLVNVAIDRTPGTREGVAVEIAKYGETDVVCHLADAQTELRARQEREWAPLRQWAEEALGVRLDAICGIIAAPQPEQSLERLRALALALDDVRLTALAHAVATLGSAILGFALERGRLTARHAHTLATLDAAWQAEQWGEDAAAKARAGAVLADLQALETLFCATA